MAQQPLVGQGLLIIETSWSYSETSRSVGFLWTSGQPDAGPSIWQHPKITTDRHPCTGGFRTRYFRKRAPADLRLRPRGYWNWHFIFI